MSDATHSPKLEDDLEILKAMLARSFDLVATQLSDATRAVVERDQELALQVRERDDEVDRLELDIDHLAETMLESFRPSPRELRQIITSIKINTDLERIGDYSAKMAKYTPQMLDLSEDLIEAAGIEPLALAAERVLWETKQAFLNEDRIAAERLLPLDADVNAAYQSSFDRVIALFEAHPEHARSLVYLVIALKSMERLSDHLMNIAESVVFRVAGKDLRHTR